MNLGRGIHDNDSNRLPLLGQCQPVRGGSLLRWMLVVEHAAPPSSSSPRKNAAMRPAAPPSIRAPSGTGSKSQKLLANLRDPAAVLIVSGERRTGISNRVVARRGKKAA